MSIPVHREMNDWYPKIHSTNQMRFCGITFSLLTEIIYIANQASHSNVVATTCFSTWTNLLGIAPHGCCLCSLMITLALQLPWILGIRPVNSCIWFPNFANSPSHGLSSLFAINGCLLTLQNVHKPKYTKCHVHEASRAVILGGLKHMFGFTACPTQNGVNWDLSWCSGPHSLALKVNSTPQGAGY